MALVLAAALCFSASGHARQLVTVDAASARSTSAVIRVWQREGSCWRQVMGPWTAHVGRNGLSSHHREGDGTTPLGRFTIGPVAYGVAADPGTALTYHRLACGDWWDEDPRSPTYNRFRHVACGARPRFGGNSEALWPISPQYRYFAVVAYNAGPVIRGRGSAIFLHVAVGATAGCISLPERRLLRLLHWLRPSARPGIHIGIT